MTEIDEPTGRARTAARATDIACRDTSGWTTLLHSELDHNARMITTVMGALTVASADDIVGYLLALPLLPDVVDCRYVHCAEPEAIAVLWDTIARTDAVVRPSAAMQAVVASDGRYDLTGIDVPALHRCPTGVAVYDTDLRFVYVNKRLASIHGISADRHRNRTCAELLHPSHDTLTPLLQRCLDDRVPIRCVVDAAAESWACRYLPVCHRIDGRDQDFVVGLMSPPWSAGTSDLSVPSARLVSTRLDRKGFRTRRT